jgi:hypothetical protein
MSAVTPDLYRPMYGDKVMEFFNKLLDARNAGKPLMRPYLEGYFGHQGRRDPSEGSADRREF